MTSRPRRLEVLRRLRAEVRDQAAQRFAAAREALAVAERALTAAEARAELAAGRMRAAWQQLDRMGKGLEAAEWRLREAWTARLRAERRLLARLGEGLRRCAGHRRDAVERARQAVLSTHRAVEVVDRLALGEAARARRWRDREADP